MQITKTTLFDFFKYIKSGIALDVAPDHTGVVIWDGEKVTEYGFRIEIDSKSVHWEYKMRRDFKNKLKEIVNGKDFEVCIIEGVYGGVNYDTTQKLLALNTVIDELLFEGVCFITEFYRWKPSEWLAKARMVYKQRGKLKTKLEIQGILEYLGYEFYLSNKDKSEKEKAEIFFEDKCDACGMLLAVCVTRVFLINKVENSDIKLSDIKMYYVNDISDAFYHKDKRLSSEEFCEMPLTGRDLEACIIENVRSMPDSVIISELPVEKLGRFGMERNFMFFDNGEGYLVYYRKGKR